MPVTTVEKYNTIEQFRVKTNLISNTVGNPSDLSTFTNSNNIISAIQEVVGTNKATIAVKRIIEGAFGWSMTPSSTTDTPANIVYTRGTEEVKCELTWVNGNITKNIYKYKNSYGSYDTISTETITYDAQTGNVASIVWS